MSFNLQGPEGDLEGRIRLVPRRAIWGPIVLLECYLCFSVLVFFFGPLDWIVPDTMKLLAFLFINFGGLALGYFWGIGRHRTVLSSTPIRVGTFKNTSPLMLLLFFSMAINIFNTIVRVRAIRGRLSSVLTSFLSPGEAYRESQLIAEMDREGTLMPTGTAEFSWPFRISTALAVFSSLYFPLGLACWRRMGIGFRLMFFTSLCSTIVFTVGVGAQSWLGFLTFSMMPMAFYKLYVVGRPPKAKWSSSAFATSVMGLTPGRVKFIVVVVLILLVTAVVHFQLDRAEDSGSELDVAKGYLVQRFATASEIGIVPITGGRINHGIVMACWYLSHGYEGLALSMELPFEWTYGVGWSKALQVIYQLYLRGPDMFRLSYLARNETATGWPALRWWSTIFPWIASDTTYFGTVFVMILIGFVMGRCWVNIILTGNPVGFGVMAQIFTLVFMFPANNALAQTLDGLFSLIGIAIIYLVSLKTYRTPRILEPAGQESTLPTPDAAPVPSP